MRALGAGRPVPPLSTRLTELAVVGDALGSAAAAVEERERERERTIEREALLGSIFDAAGLQVGIAELLEDDFRYVVANHGAAALFGRSESGVEGLQASELGLGRDEILSWLELCRRCIDAGEPITAEYGISPAGAPTSWHLATFTPLRRTLRARGASPLPPSTSPSADAARSSAAFSSTSSIIG